ncbi:MAG: hypothetical protein K2G32_05455 [Oscillospiraceae bacterium]|nr:hypothetical protein [Oscillospiraceae bacterium]
MGAFGGLLLIGAFFVYKAFTAEKLLGERRRSLGKIDSGIYAAICFGWAFYMFWNM